METGDKIIAIRKAAKLNQKDFARPLGVGASYISEIENGNKEPSNTLVSLLRAHYSISGIWWETGEGEIFADTEKEKAELHPEDQELLSLIHQLDGRRLSLFKADLYKRLAEQLESDYEKE